MTFITNDLGSFKHSSCQKDKMEKRQHQQAALGSRMNAILYCMATGPQGHRGQGLLGDEQIGKQV